MASERFEGIVDELGKARDSRAQPLQWGRIILGSVLSALISAAVALEFYHLVPDMFSHISLERGVIRFFLVAGVFVLTVLCGFPLVCAMAVTSQIVSYRRRTHALIAAPISMPVFFIFLTLWSSHFG